MRLNEDLHNVVANPHYLYNGDGSDFFSPSNVDFSDLSN